MKIRIEISGNKDDNLILANAIWVKECEVIARLDGGFYVYYPNKVIAFYALDKAFSELKKTGECHYNQGVKIEYKNSLGELILNTEL